MGATPFPTDKGATPTARLVRRWTGAPARRDQEAAEEIFQAAAGPAPGLLRDPTFVGWVALVAYWLVIALWQPRGWLRWVAGWLHAALPGLFTPPGAPLRVLVDQNTIVMGFLAVIVVVWIAAVRAHRHRARLAAAYAAASGRAGKLFIRRPGEFSGGLALLLLWNVIGNSMGVLLGLAAVTLTQAVTETVVRLVATPRGRIRLLGRLFARGVRTGRFLLLAMLATWWLTHEARPPDGQAQAQAVRADPRVAAADAAAEQEYQAALASSIAPSSLMRVRRFWDGDRRSDTDAETALNNAQVFRERLRDATAAFAALAARGVAADELGSRCDGVAANPPCRIVASGIVDGSDGRLAFRLTGLVLPWPPVGGEEEARRADAADVFRADGPDRWRLVLHATFEDATPEPPRLLSTPDGPLLVVPAAVPGTGSREDQAYLPRDEGWRWLNATRWLRQAAATLPEHSCLLHTAYEGSRPVRTALAVDWRSLTVVAPYGPAPDEPDSVRGRLEARLGLGDNAVVLRSSTVTPFGERRSWLARLFSAWPQC